LLGKFLLDDPQLNIGMLDCPYDEIVVTGCSFSCGAEMNDHLLPRWSDEEERRLAIWKWGRDNLEVKRISDLENIASRQWHKLERQNSWPALLQEKLKITVTNLSYSGASIGHSLVAYSQFLKNMEKNKKILVIHQLPTMGRMFIRLGKNNDRIHVLPSDVHDHATFGFSKIYYKKEIARVNRIYKHRVMSTGYIERHYRRILNRLDKLSVKNRMRTFYIFPGLDTIPMSKYFSNILLENFSDFRSQYPAGQGGHPIGPDFNTDMCKMIISTCF
jgi:hypothetical protein